MRRMAKVIYNPQGHAPDHLRLLTRLSHGSLVLVPNSAHSGGWSSMSELSPETSSGPVCEPSRPGPSP